MVSATARTGQSGGAVTTDSVITSLIRTIGSVRPYNRRVAPPSQLAWRGRIETLIRLAQPGLDLLLAVGDRVSRVVEREDADWTPPHAVSTPAPPPRVGAGPEPTAD
jgi:hypothetical protein